MNKTAKEDTKLNLLSTKEFRWSKYSFIIDLFSFSTLVILISILMLMHRKVGGALYENWVIIIVSVSLELVFIGFSLLDSMRKNPLERLFGSRVFILPVFTITILVITGIYWGRADQLAIVYGAICGGFAGYLAGALAYGNFFVRIKDILYRIVFGGWIGVSLGAIFGALFAGLVDPFGGKVFGGIFMGFWGGAIVSGPLAAVLLVVFERNIGFVNFFTKLLVYDKYRWVKDNTEELFVEAVAENPKILTKHLTNHELLNVDEEQDKTEEIEAETFWKKALRIILYVIFLMNPWEIETEINRVNAYREIFGLYFSDKYYKSLVQSTKGVTEENYQTISDAGSKQRQTIIYALEYLPIERSYDLLINTLNDPSCEVVNTSIKALGNLKLQKAVPHLQVILYGDISGCWESKANKTHANKLIKNVNGSLEKIFDHPLTDLERLSGKILYTNKKSYISINSLIPEDLILKPDEIIKLYRLLIEWHKSSQKLAEVSKDQIRDIVSYISARLSPEEMKNFIEKLHLENLSNLAKRIKKHEEVFV
ncbi:MAG: HEAT repeat domain-containing protein [Asgard group archaeon]|nr:HEAT repeat domain-containing protein [Asgard group archaeon]